MAALVPLVTFLGIGELIARKAIDLKYYAADDEVGYYLLPDQHGGSLVVGSYDINHDGLGVAEPFAPSPRFDVLLVGDSIVLGTSRIDQAERLGPLLEQYTGWNVWPLSAGSWSLWNELRMIERNSKFQRVDAIVFVLNAEDFQRPSSWTSEFSHPRSEPASYLAYAFFKTFRGLRTREDPFPVRQSDLRADWRAFLSRSDKPVYVIGYDGVETSGSGCKWLPEWIEVRSGCFDAGGRDRRSELIDTIHPNAKGNERLARFIETFVKGGRAGDSGP